MHRSLPCYQGEKTTLDQTGLICTEEGFELSKNAESDE
jgi:hypothetical protein